MSGTATATPAAAATLAPGGPLQLLKALAVPNPQSGPDVVFAVLLSNTADSIFLKLYTKSMVLVGQYQSSGSYHPGWNQARFQTAELGNGLYYAALGAGNAGQHGKPELVRFLVLK